VWAEQFEVERWHHHRRRRHSTRALVLRTRRREWRRHARSVNADIIWSTASGRGSVGGIVTRYNVRGRTGRDVEVWPVNTSGHAAKDLRYRFVWDFPIAISPHDHNTVYVGSQHVHRTTTGGQNWQVISPDLTLNDKTKQGLSGGIWHDNIGVEYGNVVYAIAESPVTRGLIWAGTNDGLVHLTRDGGRTWTNVTRNIPGIIMWGTIGNIEPSSHNAGTAYLTVNGHHESTRDCRRLQALRGWSHGQTNPVFT
jgi:hypothetical protein